MTIADIKTLLEPLKIDITDINYTQVIVDDSQLVKFLKSISKQENNALFFVIPEHSHRGTDDTVTMTTTAQILVMQKASDRISHDDFINVMQNTEETILQLKNWMLQHKAENPCGMFSRLIDSSFIITPVWEFASCHGHSMTFNVEV